MSSLTNDLGINIQRFGGWEDPNKCIGFPQKFTCTSAPSKSGVAVYLNHNFSSYMSNQQLSPEQFKERSLKYAQPRVELTKDLLAALANFHFQKTDTNTNSTDEYSLYVDIERVCEYNPTNGKIGELKNDYLEAVKEKLERLFSEYRNA